MALLWLLYYTSMAENISSEKILFLPDKAKVWTMVSPTSIDIPTSRTDRSSLRVAVHCKVRNNGILIQHFDENLSVSYKGSPFCSSIP